MKNGRIIKGVGGLYTVDTDDGIYLCQARGLFRKQKISPVVGDLVQILIVDEEKKTGYLHEIYDRVNELIRPKVSNVDQVVIVFAIVFPDINIDLLDRFIVLAEEQSLKTIICINKIDMSNDEIYGDIVKDYSKIGYETLCVSAKENIGIDEMKLLFHNRVSILAGPSGVGKTSLINKAFPGVNFQTGDLSKKIARGKHTTRHTEFIPLGNKGYLADSPGFTSLSIEKIEPFEMQYYFREFLPFLGTCKFNDCIHVSEPGCEIKKQIGYNITKKRYDSYLSFINHSVNEY